MMFTPLSHADYQDPALPISARVNDLLGKMTLEEKVAQLTTVWHQGKPLADENQQFAPQVAQKLLANGIGHVARPSEGKSALDTVRLTNAIQRWLKDHTRLGIPAIFHEEALHGHAAPGATSFPQAIAMASSWDPSLIEQIYQVSALEMRARGGNQALTPILDIARDPRWGRVEETMGEDPYLVTAMGVSAVRGFQGESSNIPANRVIATLKHLTGHGQPLAGMNIAPASMGERELREMFLPPFEAAVRLANVGSVMASYNEIDGIPSHVNSRLLNDILRDEWGFAGVLVSDYYAIEELLTRHGLGGDKDSVAAMALQAGVDIEMPEQTTFVTLTEQVRSGQLDEAWVNTAVKRVLRQKFQLGLFEHPYTDETAVDQINQTSHQALARQAADKALVLLKNDGLLPLDDAAFKKVAVIGPHADETLLGGYSDIPNQTVTIFDGIKQRLVGKAEVTYAPGVQITKAVDEPEPASIKAKTFSKQRWHQDKAELVDSQTNQRLIKKATDLASHSDLIVLVLGGNEATSREAWAENHLGDRTDLTLLGDQQALAEQILALGKPTVLVLSNGRPLVLGGLNDKVPAILEAWYLGEQTGHAVAAALFGDTNPGGKLPITFPRNVGQVPMFYNHKPSAKRGYAFDSLAPQYAFGHGLSYSTFEYQNLKLPAELHLDEEQLTLTFDITNTSSRDGDEVVQVYVRDPVATVTRPVMELKGFKRLHLKAGETQAVTWTLPFSMLGFYDRYMRFVTEPGAFDIFIGSASDDIRLEGKMVLQGAPKVFELEEKHYLSSIYVQPKSNAEE